MSRTDKPEVASIPTSVTTPKFDKPESLKVDTWTDFPRQPYSLITDDFVHDKLGTLKINAKGDHSTVNIKANAVHNKGVFNLTD
jgi:hypothetical protein